MTDLFHATDDQHGHILTVARAVSLTQPWATLVAIGAKLWETRSWSTSYRGWLAIHAAKGFPKDCRELVYTQPFAAALERAGVLLAVDLPLGQVIAVVRVTDCRPTDSWTPPVDSNEYAFGGYGPNRAAWKLDDVHRLRPFAAKGSLGLWRLPRPLTKEDFL